MTDTAKLESLLIDLQNESWYPTPSDLVPEAQAVITHVAELERAAEVRGKAEVAAQAYQAYAAGIGVDELAHGEHDRILDWLSSVGNYEEVAGGLLPVLFEGKTVGGDS